MLLIDCGNTRLKWCLVEKGELGRQGEAFIDDMEVEKVFNQLSTMTFNKVVVASVKLSEKLDQLLGLLRSVSKKDVSIISHEDFRGQQFAYERAESLGIDRCLVVLAVRGLSASGGLVIDSGSATTADFISSCGRHIGGYIFPGYRMLQNSLIRGTSKIIVENDVELALNPGVDTESCVLNGVQVLLSQTFMYLESLCEEYEIEKIYIAGGDAGIVGRYIKKEYEIRTNLVFEGMLLLAGSMFCREGVL